MTRAQAVSIVFETMIAALLAGLGIFALEKRYAVAGWILIALGVVILLFRAFEGWVG